MIASIEAVLLGQFQGVFTRSHHETVRETRSAGFDVKNPPTFVGAIPVDPAGGHCYRSPLAMLVVRASRSRRIAE